MCVRACAPGVGVGEGVVGLSVVELSVVGLSVVGLSVVGQGAVLLKLGHTDWKVVPHAE